MQRKATLQAESKASRPREHRSSFAETRVASPVGAEGRRPLHAGEAKRPMSSEAVAGKRARVGSPMVPQSVAKPLLSASASFTEPSGYSSVSQRASLVSEGLSSAALVSGSRQPAPLISEASRPTPLVSYDSQPTLLVSGTQPTLLIAGTPQPTLLIAGTPQPTPLISETSQSTPVPLMPTVGSPAPLVATSSSAPGTPLVRVTSNPGTPLARPQEFSMPHADPLIPTPFGLHEGGAVHGKL